MTKLGSQSLKDMKFVCHTVADSAKYPIFQEIQPIYKLKNFDWMREWVFLDSTDVVHISQHKHVQSVHNIVDFILCIILKFADGELPKIDPCSILKKIEDICCKRGFTRAHREYVTKLLNGLECMRWYRYFQAKCSCLEPHKYLQCLKFENHNDFHPDNKEYIKLLKLIKQSDVLSSNKENVTLYVSEMIEEAKMYHFQHPGVPNCSRRGKCGFIIKTASYLNSAGEEGQVMELHRDDVWSSKKSKGRVHCHDLISPENLSLDYIVYPFRGYGFPSKFKKLRCDLDGRSTSQCAMPYPLYRDFVKCIYKDSDNYHNMFVMYNVADYLVTKKS